MVCYPGAISKQMGEGFPFGTLRMSKNEFHLKKKNFSTLESEGHQQSRKQLKAVFYCLDSRHPNSFFEHLNLKTSDVRAGRDLSCLLADENRSQTGRTSFCV